MSQCPWARWTSWWPLRAFAIRESRTVEFYSHVAGLKELYPILPAKELALPWRTESAHRAAEWAKDYTRSTHGAAHKCSGIMGFVQMGWVVTAWHDFVVVTNGDGKTLEWKFSADRILHSALDGPPLGMFAPPLFGDLPSTPLPPNTVQSVLKVHTPWFYSVPKGWGLLMVPLDYSAESRFTSAIGVLNPRISRQVNPILYWHVLKGETLVRAGTPLCRMIPIRLDTPLNTVVRDATDEEVQYQKFMALISTSTWQRNHGILGKIADTLRGSLSFK